ncbi:MAG: hypothetical protein ABSC87_07650 [Halobacteriota archaeon]|jgi:hypothetical protein
MELDYQNDRLILEYHKKNASARLWERLALFDIKTGRDAYSDCMLQLATYALAWGEMKGCLPQICTDLHFKTGLTVAEAPRVTATELFAPFQTVLVAKQLSERGFPSNKLQLAKMLQLHPSVSLSAATEDLPNDSLWFLHAPETGGI